MASRGRLVVATLAIASMACAVRAPQPTPVWELSGAVLSMQGNAFEVRHKSGRVVRLSVDEYTAFARDHRPVSLSSLNPGRRVRVEVESAGDVQRARHVQIFGGTQ